MKCGRRGRGGLEGGRKGEEEDERLVLLEWEGRKWLGGRGRR